VNNLLLLQYSEKQMDGDGMSITLKHHMALRIIVIIEIKDDEISTPILSFDNYDSTSSCNIKCNLIEINAWS
jgi:hypothetical protein